MSIYLVITVFAIYFLAIYTVSRIVTRKDNSNEAYFTGNRKSPWLVVSYGYKFGFEILLFNALLTFTALFAFSKKQKEIVNI